MVCSSKYSADLAGLWGVANQCLLVLRALTWPRPRSARVG